MKKLVYTLMFLVGFSSIGFAQEANEIALTQGASALENSKKAGEYTFTLAGKTSSEIATNSNYYTNYFTVEFNEATQVTKLTMVENDERARTVIMRFLVSSGVRYTNVDGKVISVHDFMSTYLQ